MDARGLCRRGLTCSHHQGQGVTCSKSASWLMGRTCCTWWLDVGLCQHRSQVGKDEVRALGENSRIHSKEQCATCYKWWYQGKVFCSLCLLLSFFFPFPSSLLSPFPYPSFLFPLSFLLPLPLTFFTLGHEPANLSLYLSAPWFIPLWSFARLSLH